MASSGESDSLSEQPRVLLVDDNADVLESIGEMLRSEGFDVKTVLNGRAAIDLAERWRPRFVLLDLHMPILSGFEVARQLRQRYSSEQMKLILMGGVAIDSEVEVSAKSAGFDASIDKMADPDAWVRLLR